MYNIVLRFGFHEQMVIENLEVIDLTIIIPIVSKMKYFEDGTEKNVTIIIEPIEVVKEDGESN